MTSPADPRQFLYRDQLDPEEAKRLTAAALDHADDGELLHDVLLSVLLFAPHANRTRARLQSGSNEGAPAESRL